MVIYASIQPIDGPRQTLAESGPCLYANIPGHGLMPVLGLMKFDDADIAFITGAGSFEEVIVHEMLHVLGFGTFWNDAQLGGTRHLLADSGTATPSFTGAQARQGCLNVGGTITCATAVPVEGNSAGPGTADSHWRESVFQKELMTGFINSSPNPLSSVTIGSLADLSYVVNAADFDDYALPPGSAPALRANIVVAPSDGWERLRSMQDMWMLVGGQARKVRPQ